MSSGECIGPIILILICCVSLFYNELHIKERNE